MTGAVTGAVVSQLSADQERGLRSEARAGVLVAPATILKLGIVRLRPHRSSLLASFAAAGPPDTHTCRRRLTAVRTSPDAASSYTHASTSTCYQESHDTTRVANYMRTQQVRSWGWWWVQLSGALAPAASHALLLLARCQKAQCSAPSEAAHPLTLTRRPRVRGSASDHGSLTR